MALPLDLLPCRLSGDVILVPRGLMSARLDREAQRELVAALQALDTDTTSRLAQHADQGANYES